MQQKEDRVQSWGEPLGYSMCSACIRPWADLHHSIILPGEEEAAEKVEEELEHLSLNIFVLPSQRLMFILTTENYEKIFSITSL